MGVTWGGGLLALHALVALVAVLQHFAVRLLLSQDTGELTGQLTSPSPQVASAQPAMVNKVVPEVVVEVACPNMAADRSSSIPHCY